MKLFPKVSIIIPVYNGANYMREAIDSAIAQTYKNLEILVVNDGSNDNGETERIALSYGSKIRYFSKPNGGVASALNLAIREMKGEYFSWLSHDDVYLPEKIEHQVNILNKLAKPSVIIYCGHEFIDNNSKSICFLKPNEILSPEKCNIPLFPLLRGLIHGCTLLIPVKYFHEIGVFDETLRSTQDYALWFEFLRISPLHFDERILVKSRVHPDQGTHKITNYIDESNDLWSGFLKKLTLEEMTIMEGSPYLFLHRTAIHLSKSSLRIAHKLAESMATDFLFNIKITVIMPVHNRIDLAIKSIESVINQTHKCFELIIVDDGSSEDISLLVEQCNKDSRIKYIRQENKGAASARNLAIDHATGQYIAFLDSDDLFCSNKLETQLKFMEENGLSFSHTSYQSIDAHGHAIKVINSGTFSRRIFPNIISSCPIATPTVMAKSSIFLSIKFPENFRMSEDVCLWISIASKYAVGGINIPLTKVRIDPKSTASFNDKKKVIGSINIISFVMNDEYLCNFSKQLHPLLLSAAKIIEHTPHSTVKIPEFIKQTEAILPKTSIVAKLIRSFRLYGLKGTLKKILIRISSKL